MDFRKIKVGFTVLAAQHVLNWEGSIIDPGTALNCTNTANELVKILEKQGLKVIKYSEDSSRNIIDSIYNAIKSTDKFIAEDVDCVIYFVGSWVNANSYIQSARLMKRPIVIWVPGENALASGLTLKGSFSEVGDIDFEFFYSYISNGAAIKKLLSFIKASHTKRRLEKSIFGRFGGVSLGITSSEVSQNELIKFFGISVEDFDPLTIVTEAEKFSEDEVKEVYYDISKRIQVVAKLDEIFERSIRLYLALKKIIDKNFIDFCSVKCVNDLSNNYVGACLAQNLLLNEGFVSTCNSDTKGAVTMYILSLLTNKESIYYRPDIMRIDFCNNTISLRSDGIGNFCMSESTKDICLDYQSRFESHMGGICLNNAIFKPSLVNLVMISKIKDNYYLHLSEGETFYPKDTDYIVQDQWDQFPPKLPWAYVKIKGDIDKFLQNSYSGFTCLVTSNIKDELIYLANLLKIKTNLD